MNRLNFFLTLEGYLQALLMSTPYAQSCFSLSEQNKLRQDRATVGSLDLPGSSCIKKLFYGLYMLQSLRKSCLSQ